MSTTAQPPKPKRRWYRFSLLTLLVGTTVVICIAVFIKTVGISRVEMQIQENGHSQFDWTPDETNQADIVLRNFVAVPLLLQVILFAFCQLFVFAEMIGGNVKTRIVSLACDSTMLVSIWICVPDLFYLVD